MKRNILFLLAALTLMSACRDSDKKKPDIPDTTGIYILNSGNYYSNDASLVSYDPITGAVSSDIISARNGKQLGDVANDMIIYGSKMYIAVTNSAVIFVCDLEGNILRELKEGTPRHLCAEGGKVYATLFEGYAAEVDTTTYSVRKVQVGANPEGIACSGEKIYVADSFGYDTSGTYGTTVSVLDRNTFTFLKEITVLNNPQTLHAATDGTLYLVCWGNYSDIPASLQKINPATDAVTTIQDIHPTNMVIAGDDTAYLLCSSYDDQWQQTVKFYTYDLKSDTVTGEFVSSEDIPDGYSLSYDSASELLYIGSSDYSSTGEMYIVTPSGAILNHFDTRGMNPISVAFRH